jgi:hypothetical protein
VMASVRATVRTGLARVGGSTYAEGRRRSRPPG